MLMDPWQKHSSHREREAALSTCILMREDNPNYVFRMRYCRNHWIVEMSKVANG